MSKTQALSWEAVDYLALSATRLIEIDHATRTKLVFYKMLKLRRTESRSERLYLSTAEYQIHYFLMSQLILISS